MNRVQSILLAHAGPPVGLPKKPTPSRARRPARRDGLRLAVAILLMTGALLGLYGSIAGLPLMKVPVVDEAGALRRIEAQAQARRIGSILFLAPDRFCEEHSFDNFTGNTVSIQYIDCDGRLAGRIAADTAAAKTGNTQNMQDMLASFKK
jgi:hypothetical protein